MYRGAAAAHWWKKDIFMSSTELSHPEYRRDMGDGLVLRWGREGDLERITELYGLVFRNAADEPPNARLPLWAADTASGRHPLVDDIGDFALVEDTRRGSIIAGLMMMRATWEYAGIPFGVGRPEAVASHPEYRNRGLVRAIFELFHARSAARGDLVQGITGIPYFYRQFGYEYALDLGGGFNVYFSAVPKLKEGAVEPYRLRPATVADLADVIMLYERERTRHHGGAPLLVSARIDSDYWRWIIAGQNVESGEGWSTWLIVDERDRAAGYVLTRRLRWSDGVGVIGMSVEPGVSYAAVMPSVMRGLVALAPSIGMWRSDRPAPEPTKLVLRFGSEHPAYDVLAEGQRTPLDLPYAWYLRVADLPAFLLRIAPALERRLAGSPLAGHTGELKLDFYRGGLRLVFANGRLTEAHDWRAPIWGDEAQGGFPQLVFLQLLFGYRSLRELRSSFPDVWAGDAAAPLLEALFPKQLSWAMPQD
jgi:GNAT superfamily N-acetyltransferase